MSLKPNTMDEFKVSNYISCNSFLILTLYCPKTVGIASFFVIVLNDKNLKENVPAEKENPLVV